MAASSSTAGGISGNAVASLTIVTDDFPGSTLLVSLGLTRGSFVAVTSTDSVGVGCPDSGFGEVSVGSCLGSVLLFGVGYFCNFCETFEPSASFLVGAVMSLLAL